MTSFQIPDVSPAEFAVIVEQNSDQIIQQRLKNIRENIYATQDKDNIYLIDHIPCVLNPFHVLYLQKL